MVYSKIINFNSEIKIICEDFCCSVKQKAIVSINDLLHGLCSRLIDICHRKLGPKDAEEKLTVVLAEEAVKEIFSGEIETHALAEAKKTLFNFQAGILEYDEKRLASVSEKKKAKSKFLGSQFSKGVSALTKEKCPDTNFASKANKLICEKLGLLSTKALSDISSKVSAADKKELTIDDVIATIKDLIPGEMQQHAIAEGAKQVALIGSEDILQKATKQPRKSKIVPKRAVRRKPRSRKSSKVSRKRPVTKKRSPLAGKRRKLEGGKEEEPDSDEILHPAKKQQTRRSKTAPKSASRRKPRSRKLTRSGRKRKGVKDEESPDSDEILHPAKKRRTRSSKSTPKSAVRRKPRPRKSPSGSRKSAPATKRRKSPSPQKRSKRARKEPSKSKKRGAGPSKKKRSATAQKKAGKEKGKPTAKAPAVSPINLKKAIVDLTKTFNQTFSTDAVKEIEVCLNRLLVCVVLEIKNPSTIGKEEIRQCLVNILPPNIQSLAFARSSQVFIDMNYHTNYT